MDKMKKVLIIIFLSLSIASMVFALMKKTGLCAGYTDTLPCKVGAGWGNTFTQTEYNQIVESIKEFVLALNDRDFPTVDTIVLWDYDSQGIYYFRVYSTTVFEVQHPNQFFTTGSTISLISHYSNNSWQGYGQVQYNSNTGVVSNYTYNNQASIMYSTAFIDNEQYTALELKAPSIFYISYPLEYDNVTYFQYQTIPEHNKGGILTEMNENNEITSEEMPQVDTTPPTDPTDSKKWYQKILDGIGKVNNNIQGGILTITDNLKGIKEILQGIANGDSIETMQEAWTEGYENSDIYTMQQTAAKGRTALAQMTASSSNDLHLGNWTVYRTNNQLIMRCVVTMPQIFGGQQQTYTVNFGWYNNVRNWLVPILTALVFITLFMTIIRGIPNMVHGASTEIEKRL